MFTNAASRLYLSEAMLREGTQIGAYRILRQIGAGGMGEVWMAEHGMLGRRAAVKILNPSFSGQPEIVTRFFNEARATTAISDPGIVQVFDFGQHIDGSAYIVMELLEGEPLDHRLHRETVLAISDALRITRQVASSLGAAHARNIVHRDVKPENIFLVRDPEVPGGERAKVLDFGIAKLTDTNVGLTSTSAVMGTPTYMSPEQCRGAGQVDQRADVYSLGCVLFTLIVGTPPFVAVGTGDLIAMHLREAAPRASSRAAHVPKAVDDLLARCLAKDPTLRYANGAELAAALGALLTQPKIINSKRASIVTDRGGAAVPTTLSSAASASEGLTRGRGRLFGMVLGALMFAAIGIGVGMRGGAPPAEAPSLNVDPASRPQPVEPPVTVKPIEPPPAPVAPRPTGALVENPNPAKAPEPPHRDTSKPPDPRNKPKTMVPAKPDPLSRRR